MPSQIFFNNYNRPLWHALGCRNDKPVFWVMLPGLGLCCGFSGWKKKHSQTLWLLLTFLRPRQSLGKLRRGQMCQTTHQTSHQTVWWKIWWNRIFSCAEWTRGFRWWKTSSWENTWLDQTKKGKGLLVTKIENKNKKYKLTKFKSNLWIPQIQPHSFFFEIISIIYYIKVSINRQDMYIKIKVKTLIKKSLNKSMFH